MASLKLLAFLLFALIAVAYAFPQGAYPASDYKPAPSYTGGYAGGRVKIQAYRGPTKDYGKAGDYGYGGGFAPWGFYVTQPEDNKAYGY